MVEAGAAVVLVTGLVAPHVLPLERVRPGTACAVWLAALTLRASLVVALALAALLALPGTELFAHVAQWSLHVVAGPPHVDLSGEPVAHLSALGPPVIIGLSLLVFALKLTRGTLMLRRELRRRALGRGPGDSVVIADPSVLVAVPGFGRGRVVLSDRALTELDRAELDACLAHEAAHLHRGHRLVGLVGGCLAVLGRPIPGTRAARGGLLLALERDADEYAVARTGDPLALASAICKVVRSVSPATRRLTAFGVHGGGETRARLDCLLGGGRRRGSAALEGAALALALLLPVVITVALVGFGQWLASAAPPAALAAALTCGH
jgi:Zn-dependent protease with chaperone function